MVPVDNGGQVIQLIMRCRHKGFPYRALIEFTVTHQYVDVSILAFFLGGNRKPDTNRNGHPKASTRILEANFFSFGIASQSAAILLELKDFFVRNKASLRQSGNMGQHTMVFAGNEYIPIGVKRILRRNFKNFSVKSGDNLYRRKTAPKMRAVIARCKGHVHCI